MSVPSLKTIVTTEMPNFEIERICSTLGSPLIAPSTGNDSELLDLQRRECRCLRDHLHLHVGQIGHGVDR